LIREVRICYGRFYRYNSPIPSIKNKPSAKEIVILTRFSKTGVYRLFQQALHNSTSLSYSNSFLLFCAKGGGVASLS
jgi:hypothetical protein